MKRWLFTLLSLFCASTASAETAPSRWERAKEPEVVDAYHAHVAARFQIRWIQEIDRMRSELREPMKARQIAIALEMLERFGGAESNDVRIRFDVGELLFQRNDFTRSADVLKKALAEAPNHSASEEAWLTLAFACGHVGDHVCERRAYIEVLRRVSEELLRATPTLNLAETEMHLGNLKEAIEGYREALRLAGRTTHRETAPLAVWGLAVALDRSGDQASAEKEARFALELEGSMGRPQILHSQGVFFVPDYELYYYDGLGFFARAKAATSAHDAVALLRSAEGAFAKFVRSATAAGNDPWLAIAKARHAKAKAEREKAEVRARQEPVKRALEPRSDVAM